MRTDGAGLEDGGRTAHRGRVRRGWGAWKGADETGGTTGMKANMRVFLGGGGGWCGDEGLAQVGTRVKGRAVSEVRREEILREGRGKFCV